MDITMIYMGQLLGYKAPPYEVIIPAPYDQILDESW
jgi:hypothetical protein